MKTLALRIYLAVVAVLLTFALISGWLAQRHMDHERTQLQSQMVRSERAAAWAELLENSLPDVMQPESEQARVFLEWAQRLRMPMALDNPAGVRLATSEEMLRRLAVLPGAEDSLMAVRLSDGRTLWMMRGGAFRSRMGPPPSMHVPPPPNMLGMAGRPPHGPMGEGPPQEISWNPLTWILPPMLAQGASALLVSLLVLFIAVAAGAWPVANRLTRRLKALRDGVDTFGSGQLQHRVAVEGKDEVAEVARSFNDAAQRIEELVTSNRSLLANASHELRSPLARLKMAVSMMADMPPERAAQLRQEIHQDIAELDALVEEVLLASRLDAKTQLNRQPVDLLGLVTEEARRVDADVQCTDPTGSWTYAGDERLIRRAVRNLLENAKRYGGSKGIEITLQNVAGAAVEIQVTDQGPGVPADQRERIFEPFYRMPGHAEHAGGVGLGLSLVRQIAQSHGGSVRCDAPPQGGGRFTITLPR